jgi:glycine cleavage system H protein
MGSEAIRYTEEHEWVRLEDEVAVMGITDYAQSELGDITFVEPPQEGTEVVQKSEIGVIESVKAASDFYAPISGTICEINTELEDTPELINESPLDKGWICKLENYHVEQFNELMDEDSYTSYVEGL